LSLLPLAYRHYISVMIGVGDIVVVFLGFLKNLFLKNNPAYYKAGKWPGS
jgi:hypothetical protein